MSGSHWCVGDSKRIRGLATLAGASAIPSQLHMGAQRGRFSQSRRQIRSSESQAKADSNHTAIYTNRAPAEIAGTMVVALIPFPGNLLSAHA